MQKTLQSWKEVAAYVGRSVRTVQRWERFFGMPIHRPAGRDRSAVFALPKQVDEWMEKTPSTQAAENGEQFRYRILVVDDEPEVLATAKKLLESRGYEVKAAEDGFQALMRLEEAHPDIIICDLRMPRMSGFEFLSIVRRRFPHIGVIAMSAEFTPAYVPDSILADAFLEKGAYTPEQLFTELLGVLEEAPIRPRMKPCEKAAAWIPRGISEYVVVVCPYCLRAFSMPQPATTEVQSTACLHCDQVVRFGIVA